MWKRHREQQKDKLDAASKHGILKGINLQFPHSTYLAYMKSLS